MAEQGAFYMDEYKELQQYATIEELNARIKGIREQFAEELNQTDNDVLDFLAKHALKIIGVAYVRAQLIADEIGKGYRTVTTATKKLVELGIIRKVPQMRKKKGGKGANVYVILPNELPIDLPIDSPIVEEVTNPVVARDEQPKNEGVNSFKSSSKNSLTSLNKKSEKAAPATIQVELFSDIPGLIKKSLALLQDNVLGNAIWSKAVQAYAHSDLYKELGCVKIQKAMNDNENFLNRLASKLHNVIYKQAHKQITVDVFALTYSTCKGFFNDEASEMVETTSEEEELDFGLTFERIKNRLPKTVSNPTNLFEGYSYPMDYGTREDQNALGVY